MQRRLRLSASPVPFFASRRARGLFGFGSISAAEAPGGLRSFRLYRSRRAGFDGHRGGGLRGVRRS